MYCKKVSVARIVGDDTTLIEQGGLCIIEQGANSVLELLKEDTIWDTANLKLRSAGAAFREDPEDAIMAGVTVAGVSAFKMAVEAFTGTDLRHMRVSNPYIKDFSQEMQRQEAQLRPDPVVFWRLTLDKLENMERVDHVITLTTERDGVFTMTFPKAAHAKEALQAIFDILQKHYGSWNLT